MSALRKCAASLAAVLAIACANKEDEVAFERREISDAITASESLGVHFADLPTETLRAGTQVRFTFHWREGARWEGRDFAVSISNK